MSLLSKLLPLFKGSGTGNDRMNLTTSGTTPSWINIIRNKVGLDTFDEDVMLGRTPRKKDKTVLGGIGDTYKKTLLGG